ncbi:co-chaperone protein p23-1-like [Aristolochia californica]|uniref:co-chaperone protein p23-1-like n=1 Tax=Aristolochia californica TaxID=171875 RepID=UPI0035E2B3F2
MSRHPLVKWAQRADKVFITIELPDAKDVKLKLEPEGKFVFSATTGADNTPYEIDLDLYDEVDVDESKSSIWLRNIRYIIKKAEEKWWNRLLKQEGKPPVFLKVDWDKWVDEDEEEQKSGADTDFGEMDFSKLNMGGMDDLDTGAADYRDDDDIDTEEDEGSATAGATGEEESTEAQNHSGEGPSVTSGGKPE